MGVVTGGFSVTIEDVAGLPGKTEFPAAWSDDEILRAVVAVARDPGTAPEMQGSGWWRAEGRVDGILIRVVLDQDGRIPTAHLSPARA